MTKLEYQRYHREEPDRFGRLIKVGDLVAFNNGYKAQAEVGRVVWFTSESRMKIEETQPTHYKWKTYSYRYAWQVIKLNSDALADKPSEQLEEKDS